MPSTNGHGPKRAALYRRVSGEEQKQKGFSLPDQRAETLEYCLGENLELVREFEDAGYSGKFLERPDLDELRDLVASGGVDVVVVSKRDRLARGLYAGYLKNEFKRPGVDLVTLDSMTEDTPYGELLENTLDNFSEFERFLIADRMRRGKRSKAKQGKLVASPQSDYGFRYNEARDGYEVDEVRMALVRRVFRMVGVEGLTLNAAGRKLEAEGIPAPRGGRTWNRPTLRKFILSDVYLRHSYEEVTNITSAEVAAKLDPSARYGMSWYGKKRHTHHREVRIKNGKKTYPRVKKSMDVSREEWIGVPIPDPAIPRERALTSRNPGDDEEGWLRKLSDLEAQEERLLDLYLEGKLKIDRYESRVSQIKQSRKTIEEELRRIKNHAAHIERLEHDRDALLNYYSRVAANHLDELEPEERNRIYKMLDLTVLAYSNGNLEVKWALGGDLCGDNEPLPPGGCRTPGR